VSGFGVIDIFADTTSLVTAAEAAAGFVALIVTVVLGGSVLTVVAGVLVVVVLVGSGFLGKSVGFEDSSSDKSEVSEESPEDSDPELEEFFLTSFAGTLVSVFEVVDFVSGLEIVGFVPAFSVVVFVTVAAGALVSTLIAAGLVSILTVVTFVSDLGSDFTTAAEGLPVCAVAFAGSGFLDESELVCGLADLSSSLESESDEDPLDVESELEFLVVVGLISVLVDVSGLEETAVDFVSGFFGDIAAIFADTASLVSGVDVTDFVGVDIAAIFADTSSLVTGVDVADFVGVNAAIFAETTSLVTADLVVALMVAVVLVSGIVLLGSGFLGVGFEDSSSDKSEVSEESSEDSDPELEEFFLTSFAGTLVSVFGAGTTFAGAFDSVFDIVDLVSGLVEVTGTFVSDFVVAAGFLVSALVDFCIGFPVDLGSVFSEAVDSDVDSSSESDDDSSVTLPK
jgi:hypothetical protein